MTSQVKRRRLYDHFLTCEVIAGGAPGEHVRTVAVVGGHETQGRSIMSEDHRVRVDYQFVVR